MSTEQYPRTLAYLRVSSKGQIDGDGFARQQAAISKWAESTQAVLLGIFKEEGVSGTTELVNRPALNRLMDRILEGGIDTVVIEKADRLARDLIVSELLLRQFSQLGVRVIEAEGGNDLTAGEQGNPTAKLVRQILAAISEYEKSSIVGKLRVARNRKRAETGRCEGNKPYGAQEGEDAVVRLITGMSSEGLTVREIAAELNRREVKSRSGREWAPSVVARVVRRNRGEGGLV